MTQKVTCNSAEFEGLLSNGKTYTVLDTKGCSIQVEDDTGEAKWFGCKTFTYESSNT